MSDVEIPVGYRRCPKCGAANYGRITICLRCGSELPREPMTRTDQVQARFCNQCGKPVPQDLGEVRFCRHCGHQLPV